LRERNPVDRTQLERDRLLPTPAGRFDLREPIQGVDVVAPHLERAAVLARGGREPTV
jgi:hypothetical protein